MMLTENGSAGRFSCPMAPEPVAATIRMSGNIVFILELSEELEDIGG